jgi:hypothetical protein
MPCGKQGETTTETISKKNANEGGGDHNEAMECAGVDQLSAAVNVKVKRKGGWENRISIQWMIMPMNARNSRNWLS